MEPNACKTSESEEDDIEEEESEEECVREESTTPNSSQQALGKADCKEFENGVALSVVAKNIPKKILSTTDRDDLEVGRRKRKRKRRYLFPRSLTALTLESYPLASHHHLGGEHHGI